MKGYYAQKLSAERLKKCYDIASPRVRQYFEAETAHVVAKIKPGDKVLDLGCGYGRVMPQLAGKAGLVFGIDSSMANLWMAMDELKTLPRCALAAMNALHLGFKSHTFDVVVCIQNGISAFHVDQRELVRESIRVTKPGGLILFSTYSENFWDHRLEWFYQQAEAGLLGEIDPEKTGNGVIICKDGFKATTMDRDGFLSLTAACEGAVNIEEVDGSSLFCEITLTGNTVSAGFFDDQAL
jgi:2-polyprenyl-6-hydroxyphenyl methylase/3-demethylubiquinone-9 3-methyltransferase